MGCCESEWASEEGVPIPFGNSDFPLPLFPFPHPYFPSSFFFFTCGIYLTWLADGRDMYLAMTAPQSNVWFLFPFLFLRKLLSFPLPLGFLAGMAFGGGGCLGEEGSCRRGKRWRGKSVKLRPGPRLAWARTGASSSKGQLTACQS